MIPKLIMMVGLVCSGKSHKANELASQYDATVFSSDSLRQELFNNINDQEHNDTIFKELHKRVREYLSQGKSAIIDSTNINYKHRMAFLQSLNKIPCEKIAVIMATPYEMCLERNKNRERQVPEHIIKRMYLNFTVSYWYEGWDDIWIEYADGAKDYFGKAILFPDSVKDFSQDNPHHTLTLGEHCGKAYTYLADKRWNDGEDISSELLYAAILHDEGKKFTKAFIDNKGNPSEVAHFYFHQGCGCYDSLFYKYPADHLHVAVLINWHMRPWLGWEKSEKTRAKERKLLGEELYNEICLLHEADLAAH